MARFKDTFIEPAVYNRLPHITDMYNVSEAHATDLADLRSLLVKHKIPKGVSVRLIHKHFDVMDGEVMTFKIVNVPSFGRILTMRPTKLSETTQLRGVNYF